MPEGDGSQKDSGEQAPRAELPRRVELRSDSLSAGRTKTFHLDWKWWTAIGAGVVVLGLIIGLLTFRQRVEPTGADEGLFGSLPESLTANREVTHSGLSGRACDDADRRAIGVMLAADVINRPVSGFAEADMVFELPVLASNVTRLLAVYQCGRPDDIGSVRSARHDYLFLAEGVDAILGHWGGSYHALNRIAVGEFNTINALTNPFGAYFRKNHLPAPYNGFTTYENLWNALQKLEYRTETEFSGYEFKDDAPIDERPSGGTLTVNWPGAFRVHYEYDPVLNRYQRFWGGSKQLDGGSEKQDVAPSTVVIMRAENTLAVGEGGYNEVAIEGEGEATVYRDGQVIPGRWSKDPLYKNDPIDFVDAEDKPIVFTRGQVWIMAVDPGISVTWEAATASPTPAGAP